MIRTPLCRNLDRVLYSSVKTSDSWVSRGALEIWVLAEELLQSRVDKGGDFLKQRMGQKERNEASEVNRDVHKLVQCRFDDRKCGRVQLANSIEGFECVTSEFGVLFERIFRRHADSGRRGDSHPEVRNCRVLKSKRLQDI